MIEAIPKLSDESYNIYSLIVTAFFFVWAYYAVSRFYRAMLLRSSVSSEEAVLIRGIGSNLTYFENAWPVHAHAILHTRQAEPPKVIPTLFIPYQFKSIKWNDSSSTMELSLKSIVDCFVLVLVDVHVENLRLCFASTERGERNNRLSQKTKVLLHQLCEKHQKSNQPEKFCSDVSQILSRAGIGQVGSVCQFLASGESIECQIQVTTHPNQSNQVSIVGDVELGTINGGNNHLLSNQSRHTPLSKHSGLLIIPFNSSHTHNNFSHTSSSIKKTLGNLSFQPSSLSHDSHSHTHSHPDNDTHNETIRNPTLLLSRHRSSTTESRGRARTLSGSEEFGDSPGHEREAIIDFSLLLLSHNGNKESDNPTEQFSSSSSSPTSHELKIEESFLHTSNGLHSVHDVFGVPSLYTNQKQPTEEIKSEEENDCIICLTEKKEIFLLPCRHMCVCRGCFIHIDKCPVCRAPFNTYVMIQSSSDPPLPPI